VLHTSRAEVEQIQNWSGNRIEGLVGALSQLPLVFNEASEVGSATMSATNYCFVESYGAQLFAQSGEG
jgi:hypothetical protein